MHGFADAVLIDPRRGLIPYVSVSFTAAKELHKMEREARSRWEAHRARTNGSAVALSAVGPNGLAPYPLVVRVVSGTA